MPLCLALRIGSKPNRFLLWPVVKKTSMPDGMPAQCSSRRVSLTYPVPLQHAVATLDRLVAVELTLCMLRHSADLVWNAAWLLHAGV